MQTPPTEDGASDEGGVATPAAQPPEAPQLPEGPQAAPVAQSPEAPTPRRWRRTVMPSPGRGVMPASPSSQPSKSDPVER